MPTTTAKALIDGATLSLMVRSIGDELPGGLMFESFRHLIELMEDWSLEHTTVPSRTWEMFALSSQSLYTWGSGGDWNSVPPSEIEAAFVRDAAGNDYPLRIAGVDQYKNIGIKGIVSRPSWLYAEKSHPLWAIRFDVVPYDPTIHIASIKPLTPWSDDTAAQLVAPVDLPPGYASAIRYNLAIRLATVFEVRITQEIALLAEQTKTAIRSRNNRMRLPESPFPRLGGGRLGIDDIRGGYWL